MLRFLKRLYTRRKTYIAVLRLIGGDEETRRVTIFLTGIDVEDALSRASKQKYFATKDSGLWTYIPADNVLKISGIRQVPTRAW